MLIGVAVWPPHLPNYYGITMAKSLWKFRILRVIQTPVDLQKLFDTLYASE